MFEENNEMDLSAVFSDFLDEAVSRGSDVKLLPTIGTIMGDNIILDTFNLPIPIEDFGIMKHWDRGLEKNIEPEYEDEDRVLLIPINGGSSYVIIGEVGEEEE